MSAEDTILAAVTLHNLLKSKSSDSYTPDFVDEIDEIGNVSEGFWRQDSACNVMLPFVNEQTK